MEIRHGRQRETHRSEAVFLCAKVSKQDNIARRCWVGEWLLSAKLRTVREWVIATRKIAAGVSSALEQGIPGNGDDLSTKRRSLPFEMRWLVAFARNTTANRVQTNHIMHPFRTASSLSPPLFHFDSSIHHRAERVVRQQNLDPNHHAIPMPILDTRVDQHVHLLLVCATTTP
ncbi:hypothetical protein BC938DRAFT_478088 [Jimgerdemannia flammicorona]|uniref:Uncharacterized protein n=1 Tax=Jimgerdemannia flammicorona TaxID=994334 RepID=A0A433QNF0_9FUNG|nr:hypothetical protein BC938DRAFT_478088 [Jimgerdemannia flammicorona]